MSKAKNSIITINMIVIKKIQQITHGVRFLCFFCLIINKKMNIKNDNNKKNREKKNIKE